MYRFEPFAAVRYNDPRPDAPDGVIDLDGVAVPLTAAAHPDDYQNFLDDLSPYNAYQLLSEHRSELWRTWTAERVLEADEQANYYLYRIGYRDADNRLRQCNGVVGNLCGVTALTDEGPADVVPLVLSIDAPGFSDILTPTGPPLARATTQDGVHHRLWSIDQMGVINTIREAVEAAVSEGHVSVQPGVGCQLTYVGDHVDTSALPALGMLFRSR